MNIIDILMLTSLFCIWSLLLINMLLIVSGYMHYLESIGYVPPVPDEFPMVSIMVPAHNEGIVIVQTVLSLLAFNYPHNRYEIIVINDNSSDNSAQLLAEIQQKNPGRNLKIINTDSMTGDKGKSNALNIGFAPCAGEHIVIYDDDNTPEPNALRLLVSEICADSMLGAVIGKFRTRNKTQRCSLALSISRHFHCSGWHRLDGGSCLNYAPYRGQTLLSGARFLRKWADGISMPSLRILKLAFVSI